MSGARERPVVIQVIDGLERTGVEGHAIDLARALEPRAWDVSVVIVGDGPARGRVEQTGMPQYWIARATGLSALSALIRMSSQFRTVRPDIVHTHLPDGELLVPVAALLAGVPAVVSTRHDGSRVPWHRAMIAAVIKRLVPTTVVSAPEDAPDRGFGGCPELYERLLAGISRDGQSLPLRPRAWRITTRLLRAALLILLLYYITRALVTQMSQADFGSLAVDPLVLLASLALLVLYYALFTGGLALLFRANGSPVRYADIFKISFMANLGKYLPGGVWPVAARVAMAPRIQVSRGAAAFLSVVESGVSVAGACAVIVLAGLSG
ncbi:MAG: glycosyltransferase, partial [Coriobacteriia bacterium]|nr:glycosyltransferase [Coriobacteriia bacterium]